MFQVVTDVWNLPRETPHKAPEQKLCFFMYEFDQDLKEWIRIKTYDKECKCNGVFRVDVLFDDFGEADRFYHKIFDAYSLTLVD